MNEERKFKNKNQRMTYKTICTRCGKECSIPFKPTKSKPKYCQECYKNRYRWPRSSYQLVSFKDNFFRDDDLYSLYVLPLFSITFSPIFPIHLSLGFSSFKILIFYWYIFFIVIRSMLQLTPTKFATIMEKSFRITP